MRGFGHCSCDTTTGRCKFHAQLLHNSRKLSRQPDRNVSSAALLRVQERNDVLDPTPHITYTRKTNHITTSTKIRHLDRHKKTNGTICTTQVQVHFLTSLNTLAELPGFWVFQVSEGSGWPLPKSPASQMTKAMFWFRLSRYSIGSGCLPLEDERRIEPGKWWFSWFRWVFFLYIFFCDFLGSSRSFFWGCIGFVSDWPCLAFAFHPPLASRTAGWSWLC